jgi:hypothetical protein
MDSQVRHLESALRCAWVVSLRFMMAFDGRTAEDIKIRLLTAWRTDGVNLCDSARTLNRIHSACYHHFWLKDCSL